MVRSLDRIAQDELLAEEQVTDLNMDATGQGSFDVASVNPINPDFQIAQLNNQKEPITVNKKTFYLPKDTELRNKILDARDDVNTIINEMTKEEFSQSDIMNYIDMYLKENELTKDQISGKYPDPETDFIMALGQGSNKRLLEIADKVIDFGYITSPLGFSAEKIQQSVQPDIDFVPANEKVKNKLHEVFEFLHFIDPSFTPDTFSERVADNMGGFLIDSIPITGAMTKLTQANKVQIKDPEVLKGVFAKAKNNLGLMYNQIIDIYDNAKKTGNLGSVVADDILAVMGFSAGTDFGKKLAEEATEPGLIGTPLNLAIQTFSPFIGAAGGLAAKKYLYDVPIATYNATKNFFKNYSEFNAANPDQSPTTNLIQFYKNKYDASKAKEISESINTQINPDEIANRERALEIENNLNKVVVQTVEEGPDGNQIIVQKEVDFRAEGQPSLDFTLAQALENPNLVQTQTKIEGDLINSGFTLSNFGGRGKQKEEVSKVIKDLALSNYKIVNDAIQREFPDKQFVYTTVTDDNGVSKIVAVEQKVGNFNSYFNTNNRAGGVVDEQIDDQLASQQNILTPGATIKTGQNVSETGAEIRTKYETQKQEQLDLFDNKLIQLVDDSFGGQSFDISDFKDTVITKVKKTDFDRDVDIPDQFYQIRDLGNDFVPIINSAERQIKQAYNTYLDSPTTENYKKYMETMYKVEKELNSKINGLNSKLTKQVESGDRTIAPRYDMGEIKFTYPEVIKFDNKGNVIAGINTPGKSFMGRDISDGSNPGIGQPGAAIKVDITEPTLEVSTKSLINLKQSVLRDMNVALRNPSENSELIKRQSIILKEIDKVIDDNLGGVQVYDDWLKQKTQNYTNIYEKGQILKITTQDGTGQYIIPDEAVGKAFLKNPQSIEEFFGVFSGDIAATKGLEDAFYDDLFKKILNSDGLIDINKLKNYRKNNAEIIAKLDEFIPISDSLDSQVKLGVNAANRIKVLNDRKKFAEFIELDTFLAEGGLGTKLTFKNSDEMIKQALKDPEVMKDIVKTFSNIKGENENILLSAFKNKLFNKFVQASQSEKPVYQGGQPNTSGMSKFLFDNESAIKAYYDAVGDKDGYKRLLDITEAMRRLNLTGYPQKMPNVLVNKTEQIFGTGIPQILSRVFAVQSGRTSSRFVGAELGMRFMQKLSTAAREKVIASALYSKENAEALLKMVNGSELTAKDLSVLKGLFGKAYGLVGTTIDDEMEAIEKQDVPFGFDKIDVETTSSLDKEGPTVAPKISKLNIPSPSNASSLAGINMAGNVTQNTIPNTAARGQAVFGQNDPIFGGIAAV